jgi:hypothetical protein
MEMDDGKGSISIASPDVTVHDNERGTTMHGTHLGPCKRPYFWRPVSNHRRQGQAATVMPREELMEAFASRRGPSPLAICVTPCPSPPPRSQPTALAAPALLATHHPTPSLFAARDSQPSPLAASPNDLRTDTNIHAPASAVRFRGKVSLRADLVHASYASSPASGIGRTPSLRTHPTTGSAPSSPPALPLSCNISKLLHVRERFSLRGELMHAFVSYRVATEGPAGNGLSGLVAQKIRSLSRNEERLQLPRHGW